MAFDQELADRIRIQLTGEPGIQEKQMFGGLSFLLNGNMAVGVIGDELCVRVEPGQFEALLEQPGARIFDYTGRPMRGWLMVGQAALAEDAALKEWIGHGLAFAGSLPAK